MIVIVAMTSCTTRYNRHTVMYPDGHYETITATVTTSQYLHKGDTIWIQERTATSSGRRLGSKTIYGKVTSTLPSTQTGFIYHKAIFME